MNRIFTTAVSRMTLIYVALLSAVCIIFSSFIYTTASSEIDRTSRRQVSGFRTGFGSFIINENDSEQLRQAEAAEAKRHLRVTLFLVNSIVIGGGAFVCYFLAKRTLQPIEESVNAQERFTSDASHELRTPLASMKTEIEVALRDKNLTKDDALQLLESNLEEVNALHLITENLLHLARHKELMETKQIDMPKLIKSIEKKYNQKLKIADMKFEIDNKTTKLISNQGVIQQLITILLDNAIKHAGKGTKVILKIHKKGSNLHINVIDSGVGLNDEALEKIFDRFYKADESRTASRSSGHGLGLSIAKQLVGALQGQIGVNHGPSGKGLDFYIVVPVM